MTDLEATLEPQPAASGAPPARIGPYRIDGVLGRGGMGEVFLAWDEALQRPVAVKRVAGALRHQGEARARFWREARALAALDHPGIVRIHRIDETPEGDLYLAMELVPGVALAERVGTPWPSQCAAALGLQVASALGAVHAAGMTHRDVKPANILVQTDGCVRLVDFGLARRGDLEDRVTATGVRPGTPAYMAPEQVEGTQVGAPADVFSLGVVLYRLVAGVHPFARDSASATALALAAATHTPLDAVAPLADRALVAVVERCLARDPAARFADGTELAAALAAVARVEPAGLAAFVADPALAPTAAGPSTPWAADIPAASGASQPAPRPRNNRRFWIGLAVVAAAAGLGWWTRPTSLHPLPTPHAIPAGVPPLPALPPRPVVAVAGFHAPDDDPQDPRAAVLADALRHALDQVPEALISVPLAALQGSLAPGEVVGPDLEPTRLARPDRRLGHVDVLVRGTLRAERATGGASDGDRLGASDGLRIEVELVDPATGEVWRSYEVQGPHEVVEAAHVLARGLLGILQAAAPDSFVVPSTSVSAYGALLAEGAALRRGDFERAAESLDWALQLDPRFVQARLSQLALLRSRRQGPEALAQAQALLERSDLTERERALAQAWRGLAGGDGRGALQALEAVQQRWPYDLNALELLMILRAQDPELRDLAALEQVARRVLAIAPRHEGAASRLVRALAFRGRIAEAEAALAGLGIPADDPGFIEVFGEMDLYAGRFDDAARRFATAVARSPDDLYSEHMGLAADILRGRCGEAAVAALGRIDRIEALGRDGNLDWTYSLASQALMCQGQWAALGGVLDRWEAHSASGRAQVAILRPRAALAAGGDRAQVARILAAMAQSPEVRVLQARVIDAVAPLRALAADAATQAVSADASQRSGWLRARNLLEFKANLLEGRVEMAALDPAQDPALDPARVRDEGELFGQTQALGVVAEALERAGEVEQAGVVWARFEALGYPRLYVADMRRGTPH
jgi:tetratricopeptide (TPR) repeat protein